MSLRDQARDLATLGHEQRVEIYRDPDEVVVFDPEGARVTLTTAHFGAGRGEVEFDGGFVERLVASVRVSKTELPPTRALVGKRLKRGLQEYRIADYQSDPVNVETVCDLKEV